MPLEDRQAVKYALGATLVKSSSHWRAFETAFEVYFSLRAPQYSAARGRPRLRRRHARTASAASGRSEAPNGGGGGEAVDARGARRDALQGAPPRRRGHAGGGRTPRGRPLRRRWSRGGPSAAPTTSTARCGTSTSTACSPGSSPRPARRPARTAPARTAPATSRPGRHVLRGRRSGELTRAGGAAARGRVPQPHRGASGARSRPRSGAASSPTAGPRRSPRACASRCPKTSTSCTRRARSWRRCGKAIYPLTRKLATRLARKRRHRRRGPARLPLDDAALALLRGRARRAEVPPPNPAKPEIFVIADISGSVASFARFTLHLVHAIASQFSKVRSFVFIDGVDEVTRIFERSETIAEAVRRVERRGRRRLGRRPLRLRPRARPVLRAVRAGDRPEDERPAARRRPQQLPRLAGLGRAELRHRARQVYWLNPEPRSYWGSGDSIVEQYARYCDGAFECRNLRQLEAFVEHLT